LAETAATISETLKVLEPERKKSVEVLVETEPPAALFDPTENPSSIFGSDTKPSSDPHLDQLNFENNILKQQLQILSQQSLNLACNIPEHALLISRNKDLEENITKLKLMLSSAQDQNAILSSKVSTLQAQHHSTDSLKSELRGLQDQNLVLKDENRKLMQRESQLLTRISQELSPAISYELTPLIENQIQWISDQRKAYRITHNKSSFTAFSAQLDRMIMACQTLIRSAERVESEESGFCDRVSKTWIKPSTRKW
jgi:hypothetical protein